MSLSKNQIKAQIQNKIAETEKRFKEEISKLKNALEVIDTLVSEDEQLSLDSKTFSMGSKLQVVNKGMKRTSVRQKLEKILKDENTPLTSRMLMEKFNENYPEIAYNKFTSFSGSFSPQYRRPKSKIKKYEIKNAPVEYTAFYCLKEWFVADELKEEYKNKIFEKYGVK